MAASTPEGKVKAQCVELLKKYCAYYFFAMTGGYGRSGIADITVCYRGCYLAIECKAGHGTLTELQLAELAKVKDAGGDVLVIRENNIHELQQWLERMSRAI